ncbi:MULTISPECIES: GNAT family N-acetyltransferase [unclassified Fusibacter]|uniref:GNAT family N-acetyltransferase n=1 Tax=unclassified Fusibacter TaxID=2624464 RepID=UPI001012896E|nr:MULTISPECIES: GNAT family N-acetyltransferase [unclassified Fusibacter]MCK8060271.1 GNAT family N-acetyltransferase [Fusibacter sp. A2]NPE20440.1 GNAT family N-acetyltransferase [Fusibacter sp. A1]RXV63645.1 N-acetyltransferase [Fusibacter sp. A1]
MMNTKRLTIRPFTLQDKEFLYELNNDKEVNRYRSSDSATMNYCIDSINDWIERFGDGLLNVNLMEITASKEPVGLIGIFKSGPDSKAELGYRMMPRFWGQGYCKEAASALIIQYFTATDEIEIFAETHPENTNSIRFLENNRFVEEIHHLKDRGSIFITSKESWL